MSIVLSQKRAVLLIHGVASRSAEFAPLEPVREPPEICDLAPAAAWGSLATTLLDLGASMHCSPMVCDFCPDRPIGSTIQRDEPLLIFAASALPAHRDPLRGAP